MPLSIYWMGRRSGWSEPEDLPRPKNCSQAVLLFAAFGEKAGEGHSPAIALSLSSRTFSLPAILTLTCTVRPASNYSA